MALGLADALLGWVVESAASAIVRSLRGDPAENAMRELVMDGIESTLGRNAGHLDQKQLEHLRTVLRERYPHLRWQSLAELREVLHAWTATLDRQEFGEPGYLTRLGLDTQQFANDLTERIASGVQRGGPLNELAGWLEREKHHAAMLTGFREMGEDIRQLSALVAPHIPRGGGLPGGTRHFTGRHAELTELDNRVQAHDPAGAVVAIQLITGMPGVGKTELARRTAHQHKQRYPDGQYSLDLHGFLQGTTPTSPEDALGKLLEMAGVASQAIPPDVAGRHDLWQQVMVSRRALVLLDNARDAPQILPLLPNSAGCLVLITSRTHMPGLPDARLLPLDLFSSAEAIELFIRVVGADRCRDRDMVARVVRLVGLLPLAVSVVAGRMCADTGLTIAELAEDLTHAKARGDLLEEVSPPGVGVRLAFETSMRSLDDGHQRALHVLGLHPGPSVGEPQFAALADMPVDVARSALRALAERNLVNPTRNRVGHRRYELHDLMREFAREQSNLVLPAEGRSEAITRLTAWYTKALDLVDRLWTVAAINRTTVSTVEGMHLKGMREARAWLLTEQDNLLALADVGASHAAADVCVRSAERLFVLDRYTTARRLHQAAATIYHQLTDQLGKSRAVRGLGNVAEITGDYETARARYQESLTISQQIEHLPGQARAISSLGSVAAVTGDYRTAGDHYQSALSIYRHINDPDGEAGALRGLGGAAVGTGDQEAARERYQESLIISRRIRRQSGEAAALSGLGRIAELSNDFDAADKNYQAALAIYRQIGAQAGEANMYWRLGNTAKARQQQDLAAHWWQKALEILTAMEGDRVAAVVRQALDALDPE